MYVRCAEEDTHGRLECGCNGGVEVVNEVWHGVVRQEEVARWLRVRTIFCGAWWCVGKEERRVVSLLVAAMATIRGCGQQM